MKKFLMVVIFIFSSAGLVFASHWAEVGYKIYIDTDSISSNNNVYSFWIKCLNDGSLKPINGKKVHYDMMFFKINCSTKHYDMPSYITYGIDGSILESGERKYSDWKLIPPDTNVDIMYNVFCHMR